MGYETLRTNEQNKGNWKTRENAWQQSSKISKISKAWLRVSSPEFPFMEDIAEKKTNLQWIYVELKTLFICFTQGMEKRIGLI